ncbi:hypothetical protein HMPREF9120_02883 [Neisseria sp. oral taxon 020 str. F0370]|nr:hypothetical protein HMPREF9120_02883 [Neisseria sp. oral taxon 020 str. F0370]
MMRPSEKRFRFSGGLFVWKIRICSDVRCIRLSKPFLTVCLPCYYNSALVGMVPANIFISTGQRKYAYY